MDPLCHTLVGGSLAATRLGRTAPGAAATLIVAANLPDVDVLAYLWSADTALGFRRGWTHGWPAQVVLPLLLAAAVVGILRISRREVRPARIVALAYLGVLTHPLLDWLNTYGMRWGMPIDPRWSYGDTLFIIDPWLWLVLGAAPFLRWSRRRWSVVRWAALALVASLPIVAAPPVPDEAKGLWIAGLALLAGVRIVRGAFPSEGAECLALATLGVAVAYVAAVAGMGAAARAAARGAGPGIGATGTAEVFAAPRVADPFRWDVLLVEPDRYRPGRFDALGGDPRVTFEPESILVGDDDPRIQAALAAPCLRGMRRWLRFPFFVVREEAAGTSVYVLDARYTRRVTDGFGGRRVRLDEAGHPLGCGAGAPP